MTITPKKRASYDPFVLSASKIRLGSGGLAECVRYEVDGEQWVEKSLRDFRRGESYHLPWIKNEARTLAALKGYPQFVQFFGAYRPTDAWHPGLLTLMMEYIDGCPFNAHLRNKDVIIPVAYDLCEGLSIMEAKDIVHQDLKPDNILVTGDKRAKIIDFGLAKYKGKNLASEGAVLGTPEFSSPEQARGELMTPKSDLFSLALVLYEAITGYLAYGYPECRPAYLKLAETWHQDKVKLAKEKLICEGMSELFANAWELAVQPVPKERKLEPLKKELEQLLDRLGSKRD